MLCGALGRYARANPDAANLPHSFAYALSRRAGARARLFGATAAASPPQPPAGSFSREPRRQFSPKRSRRRRRSRGAHALRPRPAAAAEILGALHFLRGICGTNEGQKWRNEAQALIDAEAPAGDRHDQMVASFNRGYRAFQQSYRTCTPAADFAIRRYLDEGAKIAREITARYAN